MRNSLLIFGVVVAVTFVAWKWVTLEQDSQGSPVTEMLDVVSSPAEETTMLPDSATTLSRQPTSIDSPPGSPMSGDGGQLSEEDMVSWLSAFSPFSAQELRVLITDPSFILRLAEIALSNGGATVVNAAEEQAAEPKEVYFRHNALPQSQEDEVTQSFPTDQERIYAHFTHQNLPHDQVLVRWSEFGEGGEVLQFDRYPLITSDQHHYVWLDKETSWDAGVYRVDVFSADSSLTPLATGTYIISGAIDGEVDRDD